MRFTLRVLGLRPWQQAAPPAARRIVATARLAVAAGSAALLLPSDSTTPSARLVAWAVCAFAAARVVYPDDRRFPSVAEAALASAAIAATGGLESPLLLYGVVVAAAAGLGGGIGAGTLSGVIVTAASVPDVAREAGAGFAAVNHAATWAVLFPMAGIVAALAGRVWSTPHAADIARFERKRLANDLHDGVAQTLAHLRLELDMLSRPEFASSDPDQIARLARVAERTLADVRSIIQDLTPPPPPGGLPVALTSYIADVVTTTGPAVSLQTRGEIPALHPAATQLFRIAQEAISNAVRHSRATRVEVILERVAGGGIRLVVQDDGTGSDAAGKEGGMGLITMRERAAATGSTISISPARGGGTRVQVDAPGTLMRIA